MKRLFDVIVLLIIMSVMNIVHANTITGDSSRELAKVLTSSKRTVHIKVDVREVRDIVVVSSERIGSEDAAGLIEQIKAFFPEGLHLDQRERNEAIETRYAHLDKSKSNKMRLNFVINYRLVRW